MKKINNKKTCLAKMWGRRQRFYEFHCKLHQLSLKVTMICNILTKNMHF